MSHPNRTLNNRSLPPFNKNGVCLRYINYDRFVNNGYNQKSYNTSNKYDKLSEDSITQYLLENPSFVEAFLIQNYSRTSLLEIISKFHNTNFDTPKLSISKDILVKESQRGPLKKREIINDIHQYVNRTYSMTSLTSTIDDFKNIQDIQKVKMKAFKKLLSLQDIPEWSRDFLLAHKEINISDPVEPKSTKELLEEISTSLSSEIQCSGVNVYFVDDVHRVIYSKMEARPMDPNIQVGTTLAAYVACVRMGLMTSNVFADERFPQGILNGKTIIGAAMVQPIIMNNNQLVGVIEIYRHSNQSIFTSEEEEAFITYCMWGRVCIFFNEIYITSQKQLKLNQFLLMVTQKMFGKFQTFDEIIKDIMTNAKGLVLAERVSLFLLDKTTGGLYSQIFDKGNYDECLYEVKPDVIRFNIGEGIAGYVAATGETLNIYDAYNDNRFNKKIDLVTGYVTKTVLCMPVKLNDEIIGVVQMLNKKDGYFTAVDENDFKIFATYCGVALHIAKMYEKIIRSQQKYKVALDVLSYHSGCTEKEFLLLQTKSLPSNINDIAKFSFWPWVVPNDDGPIYVVSMFKDLFDFQLFDEDTIIRFVLTVKKNYRSVPYHNWSHAFSVAHSMYTFLKSCDHKYDLYETLALFIGCICHDLDHRGKTNQYMVQNELPLSTLYSTSTMEHHHFNMTVTILQRDGHNIFKHLSSINYRKVLGHIKHCILATDLAKFFECKEKIGTNEEYLDSKIESNRLMHMALSMTLCDLCSMFKSWNVQLSLVMIIMKEFWNQGDEERTKGHISNKMLDREYKLDLPDCQVGFLQDVCLPCYRLMEKLYPEISCVVNTAENNLKKWKELAALPQTEKLQKIIELENFVDEFNKINKLNFK